jgi:signal transduction histidine kinase
MLTVLTNAGKYSDSDTNVVLQVTHSSNQQDKQIVLTLTNFGPGISPEDATHIFDKFRRGQGVTQKVIQGTGLGLALVKCLVQHLNGTIAVSSSPDTQSFAWETCFTLTLPQFFDHTKS